MANRHILVVDDEPTVRAIVSDVLTAELGLPVEGAADGYEAIRAIAAKRPALVLLDLKMPSVDGLSVLRWMRGRPDTQTIPVLAMTGLPFEQTRHVLEQGCSGFLLKPFDLEELVTTVRPFLAAA